MIDLRLKGCGAFGLGFQRPLEVIHDRAQLCEAPFNGSVELCATSLSGALSNGLV